MIWISEQSSWSTWWGLACSRRSEGDTWMHPHGCRLCNPLTLTTIGKQWWRWVQRGWVCWSSYELGGALPTLRPSVLLVVVSTRDTPHKVCGSPNFFVEMVYGKDDLLSLVLFESLVTSCFTSMIVIGFAKTQVLYARFGSDLSADVGVMHWTYRVGLTWLTVPMSTWKT